MDKTKKYIIKIEDLNVASWEYVGEGNQHLLIKCTDQKAPLFGYLMRFNKQLQHHSNSASENHHQLEQKKSSEDEIKLLNYRLQYFCQNFLFKGINKLNSFLQEAVVLDFSDNLQSFYGFVDEIQQKIHLQRSESKRQKKIDLAQTIEIIENFNQNYGFSDSRFSSMIEIKPKSPLEEIYTDVQLNSALEKYPKDAHGRILENLKVADENERCRFFKMQLNKMQNDPDCKILSKYRPINFYKGHVEEEFKNLQLTPLNNLVITQYSGDQNETSQILSQVEDLNLALQSVLRMIHLYDDYNSKLEFIFPSFMNRAQFYLQQPESFFTQVFNEIQSDINSEISLKQSLQQDFERVQKEKDFYECKIVIKFLLSVAFRDLSILTNIYTSQDSKEVLSHQNEHQLKFKVYKNKYQPNELIHSRVAIIDNDLKPLSSYDKYMKLEKLNLELYLNYLMKKQA